MDEKTIRTAIARAREADPWRDYWNVRQKLPIG